MNIMEWPEKVNKNISIDGDYSQESGFVKEIRFDNGKPRTWQKNSYVPLEFPSLSLMLDNVQKVDGVNTEKALFDHWYKVVLRNGIVPFYFPNLLNPGENAVYQFIPESLSYDRTSGIVIAEFGFREVAQLDGEIESNLWITLQDQDASDLLPSSGKVATILQSIRNFLKWIKELIFGHNTWLPPVNTRAELRITGLNPKLNYLCKVVSDPVQSGVFQLVATENPSLDDWVLYDSTVDLVNEQELEAAIDKHNTDIEAHGGQIILVRLEQFL